MRVSELYQAERVRGRSGEDLVGAYVPSQVSTEGHFVLFVNRLTHLLQQLIDMHWFPGEFDNVACLSNSSPRPQALVSL